MSVTVTAKKTVSFKSPYTGSTFQELAQRILGRDGYLSGGATSDDATNIEVESFRFVSRGIVGESLATITTLSVPTGAEPWFVIAALADDDPDSGILVSATTDLLSALNGAIIAFKANGVWQNPPPVDVAATSLRATESGQEVGYVPRGTLDGSNNVTAVEVGIGELVDPDGVRRATPPASFTPLLPHATLDRTDYLVLRQRESFSPEVATIFGGTQNIEAGATTSFSKAAIDRPAYYARRNGTVGQQWFAWANGTALKVQGGPAGTAFAEATLLTGGGTISSVWLAGQRASDSALIVVYVDGNDLRVVSFHPTTGAQVDGPVTIDTQANAISHVRAALDGGGLLHVVFEHDEGPRQQIYYTRRTVPAGASFGVAGVTSRIVAGADTGRNDTWPDVGMDRFGTAHIVYTSGTGSNDFGRFVYATCDSSGNLSDPVSYTGATEVGYQADEDDRIGFVAAIYTSFYRARVAVTPHDEVYAAMVGFPNGGSVPSDVLLFSPSFRARLGFDICNVTSVDLEGTGYGCDILANEAGDLRIITISSSSGAYLRVIGIDTVFAPDGLIGGSKLFDVTTQSAASGSFNEISKDVLIAAGPDGDLAYAYCLDSGAAWKKFPQFSSVATAPTRATPHRKDIYLAAYRTAPSGGGTISGSDGQFRTFHTRPKRLNYPFLVGDGGVYNGFGGLHDALRAAARAGGEVVIRPGHYDALNTGLTTLSLQSHVSLVGDGKVFLERCSIIVPTQTIHGITNITGNVIGRTGFTTDVLPGDVVSLTGVGGTGFHRIREILPPNATYKTRLLVDNSTPANATPGGTLFQVYPVGIRIENLTLRGSSITIAKGWQSVVRGISAVGTMTTGQVIKLNSCEMPLVDDVEGLGLNTATADSTTALVYLADGRDHVVRNVRMHDGDAKCVFIEAAALRPHLIHCGGDRSDLTKKVFTISTGRTTPVFMTGCDGRSNDWDETVITPVAPLVRVNTDGGPIAFEDDNTRADAALDALGEKIILTDASAGGASFNGATPGKLVLSVNERVKKTGDVMSGNLTPDVTGRNLGSLTDRWDLFVDGALVNDLQVADSVGSNLVPDADDTWELGSSSFRWEKLWANGIDALGDVNLDGGIFALAAKITPSAITGTVHDYDPTGLATAQVIRQDLSGDVSLDGLAGGVPGRVLLLVNLHATFHIRIKDAVGLGGSDPENEFLILNEGSTDLYLQGKGSSALLWYDGTSLKWRVISARTTAVNHGDESLVLGPFGGDDTTPGIWKFNVGYLQSTGLGSGTETRAYTVKLPKGARIQEVHATVKGHATTQLTMYFAQFQVGPGLLPADLHFNDATSLAATDQPLDITGIDVTVDVGNSYFVLFTMDTDVSGLRIYDCYVLWDRPSPLAT